jgi:hypothetical protein
MHEVILVAEFGQALGATSAAAEVGGDPTMVVIVEIMTCRLMECTLGDTSMEHPQYYLLNVVTRPSFSSFLLLPIMLYKYPHGQSRQLQER